MFFNTCIYRIANPYSTEGWDCKSQQQASPFSYLIKDKSGRTGEMNYWFYIYNTGSPECSTGLTGGNHFFFCLLT